MVDRRIQHPHAAWAARFGEVRAGEGIVRHRTAQDLHLVRRLPGEQAPLRLKRHGREIGTRRQGLRRLEDVQRAFNSPQTKIAERVCGLAFRGGVAGPDPLRAGLDDAPGASAAAFHRQDVPAVDERKEPFGRDVRRRLGDDKRLQAPGEDGLRLRVKLDEREVDRPRAPRLRQNGKPAALRRSPDRPRVRQQMDNWIVVARRTVRERVGERREVDEGPIGVVRADRVHQPLDLPVDGRARMQGIQGRPQPAVLAQPRQLVRPQHARVAVVRQMRGREKRRAPLRPEPALPCGRQLFKDAPGDRVMPGPPGPGRADG